MVERTPDALLVPEQAIMPIEGGNVVFRVVDGKAVRTDVELGQRRMGQVQIRRGLSLGDTVIVAGQMKVRDGGSVTVRRPGEAGS